MKKTYLLLSLLFSLSFPVKAEVKFILLYETDYLKAVCKAVNPELDDRNFEVWPSGTNMLEMLVSVQKKFGNLSPAKRPIIVLPTENWFFSVYYGAVYPELNFIQPYKSGNDLPNFFNYNNSIPPNVCLVSAGNNTSDWTWGNGFTVLDSSNIQYLDGIRGRPVYNYSINNIVDNGNGTSTIYSPIIPHHVKVGWLVHSHIVGPQNNETSTRSKIVALNTDLGYIVVNQAAERLGEFTHGSLTVYYLSPVTAVVGTKLKMIMDSAGCGFAEAVAVGKYTGSNHGIRTDSNGYGYLLPHEAIKKWTYTTIPIGNYPNPFNPTTTIYFSIPEEQRVTLVVYDILGRVVITILNNEIRPPGTHSLSFNGSNLASGTYFYRLSYGSKSEIRKMILIK